MINAMISGTITRDAERKEPEGKKPYVVVVVRHEKMFVRCMVFGDDADKLERLRRGDSCAVIGSLTIGEWQGKPSYSMLCHRAISPTERKPHKPKAQTASQGQYRAAAHAQRHSDDLGDDLPWGK